MSEKVRNYWEETDSVISQSSKNHQRELERTMDQIDQVAQPVT
jgi:hypothetical protein